MEKGQLARALYSNTPESKYELFFRKGDVLTVLEFDPDGQTGWWLCAFRGERGLCPGNYLELIENRYSMPVIQNEEIEKSALESALDTYDFPRPQCKSEAPLSKTSPLELYDIPPSQLPIYAVANKSTKLRQQQSLLLRPPATANNKRASDLSLLSNGSSLSSSSSEQSGNSSSSEPNSFHSANSVLSNIASKSHEHSFMDDSGGENLDQEYDVPRPSFRVQSSMGESYGRASTLSMATTADSLDDRIDIYDVPRPSGNANNVKTLAAQFIETKYDRLNGSGSNVSPPVLRKSHNNNNARFKNHHLSLTGSLYGPGDRRLNNQATATLNSNSSTTSLPHLLKQSDGGSKRNGQMLGNSFNILNQVDPNEIYDVPPSTSHTSSFKRPSCDNLKKGKSTDSFELFCEKATAADLQSRKRASILFGAEGFPFASGNRELECGNAEVKMLPLSPKAAVSICEKLRQEVVTSINSILMYVRPRWRVKDNLMDVMPDVRFGCVRLNLAIKDLTAFCSRSVSNAKKPGTDQILLARLQRLLTPLIRSSQIIERDVEELEAYMWSIDRLSISYPNSASAGATSNSNDVLDQLVLCAEGLNHDVTEMANFIALNSTALFREEPIPCVNIEPAQVLQQSQEPTGEEDYEDCDYVSLAPMEDALPNIPYRTPPPPVESTSQLDSNDSQLLEFYSTQIATIAPLLSQSISSFISSVQQNDSPKVFNGHLKYVILLAYKMLFAGDTVHSNITNVELKEQIQCKSDELHKAVVALHDSSKIATRDFPKIIPMQAIIEHVWQTTATANQLKSIIFNATCL